MYNNYYIYSYAYIYIYILLIYLFNIEYQKSTLKPPSVMDNCCDYHYSNGLKLQVYTLAGCRMMEEIIARLDRFAPPAPPFVQLIFAVISMGTVRFGSVRFQFSVHTVRFGS